jgi:molybdopterin-guanine dinucleotide biosynthesis protein A
MVATMPGDIAGIILAGGLSRRMGGGDTPLGLLDGRPLLGHIVARLKPQVGALAINANGDPARLSSFGLPVVPDTVAGFAGPLAGILAGLEWAAANTAARRIVSVAGDTPFFPGDLVGLLTKAVAGRPHAIAVAASGGRRHPTFASWPLELAAGLRTALVERDERRVAAFIGQHDHVVVDFAIPEIAGIAGDPFFNINTPQDLAEAERLARTISP